MVFFVINLGPSARFAVRLHDPQATHDHVYAVHGGSKVARSGGRPRILLLHAQVPRTAGIQDYAHDSLPSGVAPGTTGCFVTYEWVRQRVRVARRVGTVREIGAFEGKEGQRGAQRTKQTTPNTDRPVQKYMQHVLPSMLAQSLPARGLKTRARPEGCQRVARWGRRRVKFGEAAVLWVQ